MDKNRRAIPVRWHPKNGETREIEYTGNEPYPDALVKAITLAKEWGWTAPKWYQWWRWREPIRTDPCPEVPTKEF